MNLRYAGITAATTPEARASADEGKTGSFWTNFVSFLGREVKVYSLEGTYRTLPFCEASTLIVQALALRATPSNTDGELIFKTVSAP